MLVFLVFYMLPFWGTVMTSFKTNSEVMTSTPIMPPSEWTLEGYASAMEELGQPLGISLIITLFGATGSVFLGSVCAYALSKWKFRMNNVLFIALVAATYLPYQAILIPLLQTINALDLYDNVWGLVLVHSVFGMPMCTVMMRGYYADVPDALIRQAMIDGNGMWRIYRKIVVPNTKIATITYSLLRDDLGYEGIICLDWPLDISRIMGLTGTTSDGVDVSTLSAVERYALILNTGIDMFSCYGAMPGTDIEAYSECSNRAFPALIVEAVNQGLVTAEDFDVHVGRVLKNKFDLGIFEDPYSDWEAALELIGSDEYKAADGDIVPLDNETINTLRRSEITEMEEELMVKSTIMLKNDGTLPLAEGAKIYSDSNNSNIKEADAAALAAYGTVVETMEEADVIVYHTTSFDENFDYIVEDSQAAGKPLVLIYEGTVGRSGGQGEPYWAQVSVSNAVLMQTYSNTPDHGSSVGSFYRYATPSVTAQMLFGQKDPGGSTVFEVPYTAEDAHVAWGELQMDIGVDEPTRLYMAMLAKENPTIVMPNNLGDVLYTTDFGMSYANPADIELSLLTVPQTSEEVVTESNWGPRTSVVVSNAVQKAGEPFEVWFVAKNNGGDGHVTAQITEGDTVLAEKFVALDAGQFRVITLELTLDAGEHEIALGDMTTTIVVE